MSNTQPMPKPIMRQSDYENAIADLMSTASYYASLLRSHDLTRKTIADKREAANRLHREANTLEEDLMSARCRRTAALDQIAELRQGAAICKAMAAIEGADTATLVEVIRVLEGGQPSQIVPSVIDAAFRAEV
jgi:hypothetical protein